MLETQKTSTALAPFNDPDGDIILRSADGVDFHDFKLVLSLISPVMFTLPQHESQLCVPVIPVIEHSTILHPLLLLSYPGADPTFDSFDNARAVMEAARKYDMEAISDRIGDLIVGWQHHARTAATRSLEIEDLGRPSPRFTGMWDISACRLPQGSSNTSYERGIAAQAVRESLAWLPATPATCSMQMWSYLGCRITYGRPAF
ncbi:uncharacterized protein EDB91DRAFT_1079875 [Suillus paluster]|uniref:uncharacterized protein n=1 Tax=Suillus paluster TaxID=48578 RepID=UPI001B862007|nr:uncharacterized protein EDB91DRAFT_1079875 [Suillus paluster]KAG1746522.1 hypothetical protein EDB91DRAFT_1079875 [Suillus paluster]